MRLAHHKITGYKVAVKTYEKSKMKDDKQLKRCRQEIKLMERLNNKHIVKLFEMIETSKRIHIGVSKQNSLSKQRNRRYLVMEALTGGNLCNYVKSQKVSGKSQIEEGCLMHGMLCSYYRRRKRCISSTR